MGETSHYAVIFTSRKKMDSEAYNQMAKRMEEASALQEGFMGIQSVRDSEGLGITVSYWKTLADIAKWKAHSEHRLAQINGQNEWYSGYEVRICKVEREYSFGKI